MNQLNIQWYHWWQTHSFLLQWTFNDNLSVIFSTDRTTNRGGSAHSLLLTPALHWLGFYVNRRHIHVLCTLSGSTEEPQWTNGWVHCAVRGGAHSHMCKHKHKDTHTQCTLSSSHTSVLCILITIDIHICHKRLLCSLCRSLSLFLTHANLQTYTQGLVLRCCPQIVKLFFNLKLNFNYFNKVFKCKYMLFSHQALDPLVGPDPLFSKH